MLANKRLAQSKGKIFIVRKDYLKNRTMEKIRIEQTTAVTLNTDDRVKFVAEDSNFAYIYFLG